MTSETLPTLQRQVSNTTDIFNNASMFRGDSSLVKNDSLMHGNLPIGEALQDNQSYIMEGQAMQLFRQDSMNKMASSVSKK